METTPSVNFARRNNRVLVIDDNTAIHADMGKILCSDLKVRSAEFEELEAAILGSDAKTTRRAQAHSFDVSYASQGQEGLALLQQSLKEGRPFAMAFVDMRMPPGWDGLETTLELWKASPALQIVICTAYSDYSWDELIDRIGCTDRMVILKKPFESVEVLQLANALTTKWTAELAARNNAAELEERVRLRTAELEETNGALKTEIIRRQRVEESLLTARDAAEAAARAKSTFLANMSHEVRTPMNGVIGMANLLMSTQLDEEQRDIVHTLTQSGESLLAIINDILDFSKVEAGKVILENIEFDLVDELSLAIDLNAEGAAKKGIELILDADPTLPATVKGDPVRLRQVLINLVSNAIKFTEQGEVVVRISASPAVDDRCKVRIEVADTGIGISKNALANLFQPFMQADASMTRRFGGTGLGLAISRKLVEIMGGTISADSEPGKGSTFSFEINLDTPETGAACSPAPAGSPDFPGRRLLIVDGNDACRASIRRQLSAWGVEVRDGNAVGQASIELERASSDGRPYDIVFATESLAPALSQFTGDGSIAGHPHPVVVVLTQGRIAIKDRVHLFPSAELCESKPLTPRKLRSILSKAVAACGSRSAPRAEVPKQAPAPAAQVGKPRSNARILVADDNVVNQKVAVFHMRKLGYEADIASNGREALAAIATHRYDLVFMDAHMPEIDGFEATRIIRQAQASGDTTYPSQLRIIAMTAHVMAGAREECIAAGMDDFLPKPVSTERLSNLLEFHFSNGGAAAVAQAT